MQWLNVPVKKSEQFDMIHCKLFNLMSVVREKKQHKMKVGTGFRVIAGDDLNFWGDIYLVVTEDYTYELLIMCSVNS